MQSTSQIPTGFRIFSQTPILWIQFQYRSKGTARFHGFIVLVALIILGFLVPQEALQGDFWQAIHIMVESGIWNFLLLLPILVCLIISTLQLLWLIFGRSDFRASQDLLIVAHQCLGRSWEYQIPSHTIRSFAQIQHTDDTGSFPFWRLLAISNRKVILLSWQSLEKTDWLGRVLADFYHVQFVPTKK